MEPIETLYQGYRFRSRLEARWAVFFTELGLKWQYEVEGYQLGPGVKYLPDFFFPDLNRFIEIKPVNTGWPVHRAWATNDEGDALYPDIAEKLLILCGSPWWENVKKIERLEYMTTAGRMGFTAIPNWDAEPQYEGYIFGDNNYWWCECAVCGKIGIEFDGRAGRLCDCFISDKAYNTMSPRLILAYAAAKQARFEHGETGVPTWRQPSKKG